MFKNLENRLEAFRILSGVQWKRELVRKGQWSKEREKGGKTEVGEHFPLYI